MLQWVRFEFITCTYFFIKKNIIYVHFIVDFSGLKKILLCIIVLYHCMDVCISRCYQVIYQSNVSILLSQ